ncbi:MAG: putative MFS-type transporter YcaD [Alphaproteobacteria bacterium MarineAlpha5_Bin8]|nr:MAG: putative MFS-type transporter YcaD [Alphaproteobacteria bacterium MarineAlpha5_Bin8]PPR44968.1 MAG: putative MFS-type transporter YcaD [Alphaproteobacteria bacterium MarineAlpha5_Bin7]PPR53814.1 MAG: putative MFS-type transporter YcaD [Alphaproteobacteria bacterium MarineAlpha5_Bin6]|tara:strand:- start:2899 stop:4134 length:1236 start_codon:yes stop_codon:yes gene_type:complete
MQIILFKTWALFFGFAIICLGHGLQGTLIGVRATLEGFSFISTGFIVAGYYLGYLFGSILIPILLERVGHIRVFAALASLASIAILLHTIFIDPYSWFFIRILTGVSLSGIYVIMESWLNDKSSNQTRGKILSIYMIVTFLFVGLGQFLLNLSDPFKVDLFILVSVLLSFSLIPILLSITEAPNFNHPKRIELKELYIISPLGFVGALFIGLAHSALFGYGAVYATAKELSTFEISVFMVIVSSFGAILQWPIGFLSDRFDRRIILIFVTLVASGLSIFIVISSYLSIFVFFIILALYGGMSLPMYSLAIAHINDFLQPNEIVSASATFGILVGIGAIMGPILASIFMKFTGPDGFFAYLFIVHLCLGLFGIYRMGKRIKSSDIESQYVPLPRNISAAGMELNPKVETSDD